jgi:hypothetical protein
MKFDKYSMEGKAAGILFWVLLFRPSKNKLKITRSDEK